MIFGVALLCIYTNTEGVPHVTTEVLHVLRKGQGSAWLGMRLCDACSARLRYPFLVNAQVAGRCMA